MLAEREGIGQLNDEHMEIVKFMRSYYKKYHAFPILSYVCKNIHQPKECVSEEFINPEKAWKIAGLPKLSGLISSQLMERTICLRNAVSSLF
jgi:sulfur relay (sulfurtransferase) DsrC/TusE family protein